MNKQTQALKLALEALEWINRVNAMEYEYQQKARESLNAIYDALAEQPAQQQEPVAYSYTSRITGAQGFSHHPMPRFIDSESWDIHPLYTSPPASKPWVGLTEDEIEQVCVPLGAAMLSFTEVARAIEAKLKEKNA